MTTPTRSRYAGHRFPAEIISHAIWLYFRWLLLGFGVVGITYATKPATRVPSRALPRRRALCTSWKKQR
jgi:hypothetical protein